MTYYYYGTSASNYYNYMGSDSLYADGYGGNDTIWGNTNNDTIWGNTGNDILYGWSGNDYLYGESGNDSLYGGTGNDLLNGGDGNDLLNGEDGTDTLYGGFGTDTLYGGLGNDTLYGSSSTTYNSNEYDVLNGGGGYDRFILGTSGGNYYQGNGYATIQDYNGAYDYIQVRGSASSFYLSKTSNFGGSSALDTAIYQNNGDLLAIVQDTTSIQLTSYYFTFV
ncbi:MAG: calcium-binding protein [Dolichospermum sp. DEX182a]|nr:calcium-binding protein [Dolichospermum sp. DEX182a]